MADNKKDEAGPGFSFEGMTPLGSFLEMQGEAMRSFFANAAKGSGAGAAMPGGAGGQMPPLPDMGELSEWAKASTELQQMWFTFLSAQAAKGAAGSGMGKGLLDPAQWLLVSQSMAKSLPQDMMETSTNPTEAHSPRKLASLRPADQLRK